MKNFKLLFSLCLFLVFVIPVESFSQDIAGIYTIPNSESILEITETPDSKKLTASIKGVEIRDGGTIVKPIKLRGKYKLIEQGPQGEKFYLIVLQGMGKWKDSSGKKFPIAFTLSGFMTKNNARGMTSQFAAAFEFSGNAEDIIGGILGWRKKT